MMNIGRIVLEDVQPHDAKARIARLKLEADLACRRGDKLLAIELVEHLLFELDEHYATDAVCVGGPEPTL